MREGAKEIAAVSESGGREGVSRSEMEADMGEGADSSFFLRSFLLCCSFRSSCVLLGHSKFGLVHHLVKGHVGPGAGEQAGGQHLVDVLLCWSSYLYQYWSFTTAIAV